ncbi:MULTISPECIES: SMEK domain-containing protein [Burkholderia cepacia complex]|uniref:SMEK domain-containing protein n=1 Tax=Burkholderia cepacia complex TaxID=87882 RepID=UPI000756CBF3|nr:MULTISPECIES: SMEK domain-containing protein [Burkholderia cepacia complex]KVN53102.1 hypothetical protein WT13_31945 [Burkholderia anthina]MBU9227648.1 SMEK domain-containing protein [Burkholderia multivorans]MBU9558907.1 SMEK domain-containing protein [Burkholderia multivorans]
MVLEKAELFEGIVMRLSVLRYVVKSMSKRGLTDVNRHCERFYCEVLNRVYGYHLVNANDAKMNAAAIDLADASGRLCFQLSSTSRRSKVEMTIETFIENELYEQYDRLMFLMLVGKTNYSKDFETDPKLDFKFDHKTDIIDIDDVLDAVEKLPLAQMKKLSDYVAEQLHPVARAMSPDSLLAQAEKVGGRPPKSAKSFLKHAGEEPGSADAKALFDGLTELHGKLVTLSRRQREFLAYIFEHGNEQDDRILMRIKTTEQKLRLTEAQGYEFYQAHAEAGLLWVDEDSPTHFHMTFSVGLFPDVFLMLRGYLKTPEKFRQALVDCDFTALD